MMVKMEMLKRTAMESEDQKAKIEAVLLENEARYGKGIDEMFDQWLAFNEVAMKDRDAKIEDLKKEAEGFKSPPSRCG